MYNISIQLGKKNKTNLVSTVSLHAGHDASDGVGQGVERRNGGRVDQLVRNLLQGRHGRAVFPADPDGSVAGSVDGLEGILDLNKRNVF